MDVYTILTKIHAYKRIKEPIITMMNGDGNKIKLLQKLALSAKKNQKNLERMNTHIVKKFQFH